jgi:hypothetical protein
VSTLVGTLRRVLARASVHRAIDGLSDTVLTALGVRLAVAGRAGELVGRGEPAVPCTTSWCRHGLHRCCRAPVTLVFCGSCTVRVRLYIGSHRKQRPGRTVTW